VLSAGTRFWATSCSVFSSSAAGTMRKAGRIVPHGLLVEACLQRHRRPCRIDGQRRAGSGEVLVGGLEQGIAIGHSGVCGNDAPDHIAFQLGDGVAIHRRDPGAGIQIVIDQGLAGDRNHPAIGLALVAFLGLALRAALQLAAFAHLQPLRGLVQLHPLHRLEVGGKHLAAEQHEGAEISLACRSVLLVTADKRLCHLGLRSSVQFVVPCIGATGIEVLSSGIVNIVNSYACRKFTKLMQS